MEMLENANNILPTKYLMRQKVVQNIKSLLCLEDKKQCKKGH